MKKNVVFVIAFWGAVLTSGLNSLALSGDWPQWLGPNRNGHSTERGILKSWPADGPTVVWRTESGDGYSAISVANGLLYTMYGKGSDEFMICLESATGKEKWRVRVDAKYRNSFGNGSRMTPTVDGNRVYAISAQGQLHALNARSGTPVWRHDLGKEYGAKIPTWGVSMSPLVYGNLLIVDVGGKGDFGLVAFNKLTGKVVWTTGTNLPGYSAPIAITVNGMKQIITFTGTSLISVSPKNGAKFWNYTWRTMYDVNSATPVFIAPDKVFISSGYGTGGVVLQMKAANGSVRVEEVWKSKVMRNHFATSLLIDGYLYGFDEATLKCVDVKTGRKKWAVRRTESGAGFGKGSLIYADGHLIVLSDKGVLTLVEAKSSGYIEKASAQVLTGNRGRCWTIPALSDGKLYVRNQTEILCLQLSGSAQQL